ncbi:hypothetical protein GF324_00575 [bacterium]|nr:hypothetical protein [bacterium]
MTTTMAQPVLGTIDAWEPPVPKVSDNMSMTQTAVNDLTNVLRMHTNSKAALFGIQVAMANSVPGNPYGGGGFSTGRAMDVYL